MLIKNTITSFLCLLSITFISKLIALSSFPQLPIELLSADGIQAIMFGLRLDATAAALLTAPIFLGLIVMSLFRKEPTFLIRILLSLATIWIVGSTFSDCIYAKDASKHVTFELFNAQGMEWELITTAFTSYWGTIIVGFGWLVLCLWVIWKCLPLATRTSSRLFSNGVFALVWLLLTVSLIRGGWHDAPQTPMSAYKAGSPEKAFIAWNVPYSIGYYLGKGSSKAIKKVTKNASKAQLDALTHAQQMAQPQQLNELKSANIVVVLLESWPAFDMQSYAGVANATPFFDQLRKRALTTHSTYADAYRTVQGTFSTFCSYPNPINCVFR